MFYQELIVEFVTTNGMYAYNAFNRMDDNIEIAYWSYLHKAWILHKRFQKSVIHYIGHPIPFESKSAAAKSNQMFNPSFYSKSKLPSEP